VAIGDRVLVGDTKSGAVVFIGPTQFAAGEWVGVELDAAVGKNDGSVNGVRYFTCKPLHGVFAKAAKLTKLPPSDDAPESGVASAATSQSSINTAAENNDAGKSEATVSPSDTDLATEAGDRTVLESPVSEQSAAELSSETAAADPAAGGELTKMLPPGPPEKQGTKAAKRGMIPRPMHGSTASLHRGGSIAGSTTDLASAGDVAKSALKVGDRVVISGHKVGTARYIGTTDFAKGEWVGVELDEPLGKNDGCIQGKR